MEKTIDLRGLSCPIPLIKTRDALATDAGLHRLTIIVDEPPAKENIVKFAKTQKYQVECNEVDGDYAIVIRR